MGEIFVEGLGTVQIEGSEPTEAESKAIASGFEQYKDQLATPDAEKTADTFLTLPKVLRFGTEVGLAIAGTVLTGGLGLPAIAAARGTMLARPFLTQLAKSSLGAGAGGGTGAGVSQLFDPKDDITREILRGATEATLGEAIGVPVVIKGAKLFSAIAGKAPNPVAKMKEYLKPIEGAHEAEQLLFLKKGSQADKIIADPVTYASEFYNPEKVVELAKEAKKGLTMGMKTESRGIDTLENIATGSFFGADELIGRKEALAFVGQTAQKDYLENITKNLTPGDMGRLFFETITDGQTARKAYFKGQYDGIDKIVRAELGLAANQAAPKLIPGSLVTNALKKYTKDLQIPEKEIIALNKTIAKQVAGKRFDFKSLETLRSQLGQSMNDALRNNNTQLAQAYKAMRQSIDDTLNDGEALKKFQIPEVAVEQLKRIRSEYAASAKLFDEGVLATILKKGNQDGGVDDIFGAIVKGKDKPELVGVLKSKLDDLTEKQFITKDQATQLNESLKGQFLSNIFERSKVVGAKNNPMYTDFVDAGAVTGKLSESKKVYNTLFTEPERNELSAFLKNLAFSQGTVDQKTGLPGKMFIQLKQAGAIGNVLSFGGGSGLLERGAATILIAPAALTKIMLNPKINQFLFEETAKKNFGKTSPGVAGASFRQLVGRLITEGLVPEEEGNKAIEDSKVIQEQYEKAGIKNVNDIETFKKVQAANNFRPVNTQVSDPRMMAPRSAPISSAPSPAMPMAPQQNAGITSQGLSGATYQGLFPFDTTGQAIARGQQ
jgi:hypothetical protein